MIKKVTLLITTLWYVIPYFLIKDCTRLTDKFHISTYDLQLRLTEAIHNDVGVQLLFVRIFHNKIFGLIQDIYRQYLYFWDTHFLINILSIVGLFGLLYGVWYFFRYKKLDGRYQVLIILLVIMPLFELFVKWSIPLPIRMFLLFLPAYVISLLGLNWFLSEGKNRTRVIILAILGILSIGWMSILADNIAKICLS